MTNTVMYNKVFSIKCWINAFAEGFLKEILSCRMIFFNNDPVIMQYLIKVHQNCAQQYF